MLVHPPELTLLQNTKAWTLSLSYEFITVKNLYQYTFSSVFVKLYFSKFCLLLQTGQCHVCCLWGGNKYSIIQKTEPKVPFGSHFWDAEVWVLPSKSSHLSAKCSLVFSNKLLGKNECNNSKRHQALEEEATSLLRLNLIVLKIMLRVSVCGKYFLCDVWKLINAYSSFLKNIWSSS